MLVDFFYDKYTASKDNIKPNKSENKCIASVRIAIDLEIKAPIDSIIIKVKHKAHINTNLPLTVL